MVIRCERCSTMYELDESLLAPEGSPVQCTRCQHVFTAFPPRSAGRTLAGAPAHAREASADGAHAAEPAAPAPAGGRASPSSAPPASREAGPRGVRSSAPPVYRPPSSSAPPPVSRSPVLKRDTVGTFEARLRWSARWRWLAPTLAGALVVVVAAAWFLLSRSSAPAPARGPGVALVLLARDDGASLDEAAEKLGEAAGSGERAGPATADHALALVLRAAGLVEEREAIAARLAARADERQRLRAAGADPGDADAAIALLEREVRTRDERVRSLSAAAADRLRAAQASLGDVPEVLRAAASLHALHGERDQLQKLLRAHRGRRDPWLDLADGWLDARDADRAMRERALVKLGSVAAVRPDLLRARYLLARAEASLGRRAEALAGADGILAANRRHEGARRLREELSAQPPPPAPPPAVAEPAPPLAPPPAPRAEKPLPQRRKIVPQRAPDASPPALASPPAAPGEGTPPAGTAGPAGERPSPAAPAPGAPARAPAATRARPAPTPAPSGEAQPAPAVPEPAPAGPGAPAAEARPEEALPTPPPRPSLAEPEPDAQGG